MDDCNMNKVDRFVEIMDTTLRDGEQTPGVAYTPNEKMQLAALLLEKLHVDRLEIASARVSAGEQEGVGRITSWAEKKGYGNRIEILGFVDNHRSVDWITAAGGKVINLLCKGSERHCRVQLNKSPEEHFAQVGAEITYAVGRGLKVNVYLEDWSNGMKDSLPYILSLVQELQQYPVQRIMLPDTLGILNPDTTTRYFQWMRHAFPTLRFDFHGHNDYGLVTANSLAAVLAGANGIHTTVNGLGERAGNQNLFEIVAAINDMSDRKVRARENQFEHVSRTVQMLSGKRVAANAPIIGNDVFTQTCGVHADGDKKGDLYANPLLPERFSRKRRYALGKLSGKASIDKNLEEMGLELEPKLRDRVLQEVIRLGDKKKNITPEDLPFIIADIVRAPGDMMVRVKDYRIVNNRGEEPSAKVTLEINGGDYVGESCGDGGYDAFVKASRKIMKELGYKTPKLLDYEVRIPPGGKTDALVETTITWETDASRPLVTIGIDCDQLVAAIESTVKMLNYVVRHQPQ
ncbi:MAG: alpha-isopropylmalate synthase regulatory domain-containing protein [Victivallales bacterium]|nr:alpha-isopropylmalate synthase regulatory domain-containing protein [Victivallales bacterium]